MPRKDNSLKPGDVFGEWTVLEFAFTRFNVTYMKCRCSCGIEKPVSRTHLRRGKSKSCRSCASLGSNGNNFIHGGKRSHKITYSVWKAMRKRCNNPSDKHYSRYGGRGVKVCDRWNDFRFFLEDMGERPSPEHQIDRIDNEKGYSPENCRWATATQNARNTSRNRLITLGDETHCLSEWAEIKGINVKTINTRLNLGWSEYDAINTPVKHRITRQGKPT